MLGFMKTDVDVGYYNAAIKIKNILRSLVGSLGNVLLPRMSYYVMEKKSREFLETMLKALNVTSLMSVPLVIYFVIFAGESIHFLAGDGYSGAILAMQIITIAVIPIGLTGVLGVQVLTSLERERYVLCSVIIGASVDFALNLICIPMAGAAGAAFSTMVAEYIVLLVQLFFTRKLIAQLKHRFRILRYLGLSILAGAASCLIKEVGLRSSFLALVISAAVFFSIYGIGLLALKEPVAREIVSMAAAKLEKIKTEKIKY